MRSVNRVQLESDTHQAAVRLTWDNQNKNWLLTAFEKKNSASDNTTDTDETSIGGKQNDTATLQNTVSTSEDSAPVSNSQKNAQESGENTGNGGQNALQNGTNELNLQQENEQNNVDETNISRGGQVSQSVPQGEHRTQTPQIGGMEETAARLRERIEAYERTPQSGLSRDVREIENRVTREYAQENGLWIPFNDVFKLGLMRLYNAIEIDGKVYRVKSTVRKVKQGDKYYTYEVQEMELLEERGANPNREGETPHNGNTSNNSITRAKLLKGVKKTNSNEDILQYSKVVDENGKPMVVYHRTPNEFTTFGPEMMPLEKRQ